MKLIIAARDKGGPFRDLHDLCSRVESRAFNKKLLESLVKSGACDDFGAEPRGTADADRRRAGAGEREGARSRCGAGVAARHARADGAATKKNGEAKATACPIGRCASGWGTRRSCWGFTSRAIRSMSIARRWRRSQLHTIAQLKEIGRRDRYAAVRTDHESGSARDARRARSRGRA